MAGELQADISEAQALGIGLLALGPKLWIHRRVEEVTYLDAMSSRRRISLDFTVPRSLNDSSGFLPLTQFAKSPLTRFDLLTETGRAIPMLTTSENAQLSTSVLLALARLERPEVLDSIAEAYIPLLVRAIDERDRTLALERIFDETIEVGRVLAGNVAFRTLALELARNFILYLPVGARDVGSRRVVKLAYDAGEAAPAPESVVERLGWRAVEDQFLVANGGGAQSCHLEFVAPEGMRVAAGSFAGRRNGTDQVDRLDRTGRRVHFHLSDLDRALAVATVNLRARSRLLGGAAFFSWLSSFGLAFIWWRVRQIEKSGSVDPAVVVLAVLPGIVSAYLTRPDEHETVSLLLDGVRAMASLSALIALAAALMLFGGFSNHALRVILFVATAASTLLAAGITLSWARNRA